jgi:hypothetical protein
MKLDNDCALLSSRQRNAGRAAARAPLQRTAFDSTWSHGQQAEAHGYTKCKATMRGCWKQKALKQRAEGSETESRRL